MELNTTRPKIGQTIPFRNTRATIIAVYDFGTIDVEVNGKFYRVTGLSFI